MRHRYRRVGFTAAQSAELWERWKKGEGLKSIGRVFGKPSSCIFAHIRPSGGIKPPPRRRSPRALTLSEREEISRGLVAGRSLRTIAATLARSPSTISREISGNGGAAHYRAAAADSQAWKRALRPKPCKLAVHTRLRQAVAKKLELDLSPEQISGWLKRTFPQSEALHVSHETLYRSLYVQARGVLKKQLLQHLRPGGPSGAPAIRAPSATSAAASQTLCQSASGLLQRKIAPSPAIGRAISFADPKTASSSPWSSGTPAMCCSPRSPIATPNPSSPR